MRYEKHRGYEKDSEEFTDLANDTIFITPRKAYIQYTNRVACEIPHFDHDKLHRMHYPQRVTLEESPVLETTILKKQHNLNNFSRTIYPSLKKCPFEGLSFQGL